ncbi:MAG: shikimate kinase [Clostridiales bacterium]|nr:shikimate kinase [Clostridiales bacterium]
MNSLEEARAIIDECDKKIVEMFELRMQAVLDVLKYKREHKLPVFQPEREQYIFKKVNSYLRNAKFSDELESLYSEILGISKRLQSKHLFPFNLIFIGFMGGGKTSVGKKLSTLLEMNFIDIDDIVVRDSGMSINNIFDSYGEGRFRNLETMAIQSIKGKKNTIISCGGGVVLNSKNVDLLKDMGKIIWLKVSPKIAYSRLLADDGRPLLKDSFSLETINEILSSRLPLYENASDIIINTDEKNVDQIACEVIEKLLDQ